VSNSHTGAGSDLGRQASSEGATITPSATIAPACSDDGSASRRPDDESNGASSNVQVLEPPILNGRSDIASEAPQGRPSEQMKAWHAGLVISCYVLERL
jgi:hypothetical protein